MNDRQYGKAINFMNAFGTMNKYFIQEIKQELLKNVDTTKLKQFYIKFAVKSLLETDDQQICTKCDKSDYIFYPITHRAIFCVICKGLLHSYYYMDGITNEVDYVCNEAKLQSCEDIWRFNYIVKYPGLTYTHVKQLCKRFIPNLPLELLI